MFRITADITIGDFKPFKCTAASWNRNIDNFSDSAKIKVPAICRLLKNGDQYDKQIIATGLQFNEGMPVSIAAGYDNNNVVRFKGFVKRINFSVPLEIECEGYSYLLRKVMINKTYLSTTVKQILGDLVAGTAIKLSDAIPNIPLSKVVFKNVTGIDVLKWFKEKCLLTVYFNLDTLYAGLEELEAKTTVKHRLGWNVVKDEELLFNADKEFAEVNIQLEHRQKTGHKRVIINGPKSSTVKVVKVSAIDDEESLKRINQTLKLNLNNKGYTGKITAFLEPVVEPGMADNIDDGKYPERKGLYFVESIGGEISSNGGRQVIGIGRTL